MLVIIQESMLASPEITEALKKHSGWFKARVVLAVANTENTHSATRIMTEMTPGQVFAFMADAPTVTARVDTIADGELYTCRNFPGKYLHFEKAV